MNQWHYKVWDRTAARMRYYACRGNIATLADLVAHVARTMPGVDFIDVV